MTSERNMSERKVNFEREKIDKKQASAREMNEQ